jgi:hypothetical protein
MFVGCISAQPYSILERLFSRLTQSSSSGVYLYILHADTSSTIPYHGICTIYKTTLRNAGNWLLEEMLHEPP